MKEYKTFLQQFIGLMFRNKDHHQHVFRFNKIDKHPIHTFFVFHTIKVIWFDYSGNIIDEKIVKPFTFNVNHKGFSKSMIEEFV